MLVATAMDNPTKNVSSHEQKIAGRLLALRLQNNIELTQLASSVGISAKELELYELGIEAIPASVLICISSVLGVSFDYFYDNFDIELEAGEYEETTTHLVN